MLRAAALLSLGLLCAIPDWARSCGGWGGRTDEGGGPLFGAASPNAGAQVEDQVGEVSLSRDRLTRPLTMEALRLGDALSVGAKGAVGIRFKDGWRVELGPEARMILRGTEGLTVLEVNRGVVLTRLKEGDAARSYLTVLTPFGFARVGPQPSEANLSVGVDAVEVTATRGALEFVARSGGTMTVEPGERVRFSLDGAERMSPRAAARVPTAAWVVPEGRAPGEQGSRSTQAPQAPVEARKGQGVWKTVSRTGQALEVGDAVRVKQGNAGLQFEGIQLRALARAGSEWVLGPVGQVEGRSEASLELLSGGLTLSFLDPRTRLRVSGLELEAEGPGQVHVEQTPLGLQAVAATGDFVARSRGVERPLQAGARAVVAAEGPLQMLRSERPPVVIPSRPQTKVYQRGLSEVALAWEGPSSDYEVVVSGDAGFKESLVVGKVHEPWVRAPAPEQGGLYWRITSATGEAVAKGSASFFQEEPGAGGMETEREHLRAEVRDGAEPITLFFQQKSPAIGFSYSSESRAASYRIQVFSLKSLSRPVAEVSARKASASLPEGALSEGKYAWSVTPLSASGEELRGGKMNRLTLTRDPAVSVLTIRSPQNDAPAAPRIAVSGAAPPGTQVQVNGKPMALDAKGRFEGWVAPVGEPAMVVFRGSRGSAPEMVVVRTLKGRDAR